VHGRQTGAAEPDHADIGTHGAVERREAAPRRVIPDGKVGGQLIPTRPFTERMSGAGS
jgi:hypothetical protein